ncbi:hypothetical protein BACI348_40934 [Bacillus altitudinis]|uniref:Uncharacterized protein n=1 Tax=Bacillus altitudinis TaxID=293387 RepID=A0A653RF15_BACAB|nr:hypothetical protein BACI348_40934 [Bacillus altitudinis]
MIRLFHIGVNERIFLFFTKYFICKLGVSYLPNIYSSDLSMKKEKPPFWRFQDC